MAYRFELKNNGGRDKVDCPVCGGRNRYTRVFDNKTGEFLPAENYGVCDRENRCERGGMENALLPESEFLEDNEIQEQEDKTNFNLKEGDSMAAGEAWLNEKPELTSKNILINELKTVFDPDVVDNVMWKYRIGTFVDGGTVFPYIFENRIMTGKIIWYNGLHRNKEKQIMWLHSYNYKISDEKRIVSNYYSEDYVKRYPLFGWDTIPKSTDVVHKVCVVESEKSALIGSIVIPEVSWVATGALSWLQKYRIPYHFDKLWYWIPDMGMKTKEMTNGQYWERQISNRYPSLIGKVIDFVPELTPEEQQIGMEAGFDVADFIIAGGGEYVNFLKNKLKLL